MYEFNFISEFVSAWLCNKKNSTSNNTNEAIYPSPFEYKNTRYIGHNIQDTLIKSKVGGVNKQGWNKKPYTSKQCKKSSF